MPLPKFAAGFLGFFGAFRPSRVAGAAKTIAQDVAAHIPHSARRGVDYGDGYYDRNAAPPTRGEWNRIPGGAPPQVLPPAPPEVVTRQQALREAEARAHEDQQQAQATGVLRQIPVIGAPGAAVVNAAIDVAEALGYDPVYHWPHDADPYAWASQHAQISSILGNPITRGYLKWCRDKNGGHQEDGSPMSPLQWYWIDHDREGAAFGDTNGPPLPPAGFGNPPSGGGATWQQIVAGLDATRAASAQLATVTGSGILGIVQGLVQQVQAQAQQTQPLPVTSPYPNPRTAVEPALEGSLLDFTPKGAYLP